jgi:hypothetical protein
MTDDDMIRMHMTAAGMLMEDLSARLILEPLDLDLPGELREAAAALINTADRAEAIRHGSTFATDQPG